MVPRLTHDRLVSERGPRLGKERRVVVIYKLTLQGLVVLFGGRQERASYGRYRHERGRLALRLVAGFFVSV